MWVLVDVVEVQRQDVVLASNVHAIIILIHAQDAVVSCVEKIGKVMRGPSGSQLCFKQIYKSVKISCGALFAAHMYGQLTHSS